MKALVDIQGEIFEPCVGAGDIALCFPGCKTNDINPDSQWPKLDFNLNAAIPQSWQKFSKFDWVVTNPPFSLAEDILPLAWEHTRIGVAFLLHLSFIEPTQSRGDWLEEHLDNFCKFIPINPRINFREDTDHSDSVTVAWFVWRHDWSWKSLGVECPFSLIRNWR